MATAARSCASGCSSPRPRKRRSGCIGRTEGDSRRLCSREEGKDEFGPPWGGAWPSSSSKGPGRLSRRLSRAHPPSSQSAPSRTSKTDSWLCRTARAMNSMVLVPVGLEPRHEVPPPSPPSLFLRVFGGTRERCRWCSTLHVLQRRVARWATDDVRQPYGSRYCVSCSRKHGLLSGLYGRLRA